MSFELVAADPSFRALKALWQDEIPFPIPAYERAYLSAPDWWGRLLDDHYLLWVPRFHIVIGPSGVEQLDLKVDKKGRPTEWRPDEWLLPAHEAVKRVRGRKPRAPWRWLRMALAFQGGVVDGCGHRDPVEHISSMEGFPSAQVAGAILRACRLATRHLDKALASGFIVVSEPTKEFRLGRTTDGRRGKHGSLRQKRRAMGKGNAVS